MSEEIPGTVATQGVGGNRGGRIVSYEGAAIHLNTGGMRTSVDTSSQQISLNVLGDMNVPQLHARQIIPNTQTAAIAQGPLISPEAMAQGLNVLAQATVNYTESVNTLRAKKAALEFRSKVFDVFNGDDKNPGYLSSRGFDAIDGYKKFNAVVDDEMGKTLQGLNPASRQKALMDMFDVRESFLSKAANHATSEKTKIEFGVRQAERDNIRKELHSYPPDALGSMQVGPDGKESYIASNLKQRFFSTFEVDELDKANAAWSNELLTAAERVYLDGRGKVDEKGVYHIGEGLEDVKVFYDVIGKTELPAEALVGLEKAINQWEEREGDNFVANVNMREASEKKYLARVQHTTEATLMKNLYSSNKVMDYSQVWSMVESQEITPEGARSYISNAEKRMKGDDTKFDPEENWQLREEIRDSASSNFILEDGTSMATKIANAPGQRQSDKAALTSFMTSLSNKEGVQRDQDLKTLVKAVVPKGTQNMWGQPTGEGATVEKLVTDAYTAVYDDLAKTLTPIQAHKKALESVEKDFHKPSVQIEYLPSLYGGKKPQNIDQLDASISELEALKNSGKITKSEYTKNLKYIQQYQDTFESFGKEQ